MDNYEEGYLDAVEKDFAESSQKSDFDKLKEKSKCNQLNTLDLVDFLAKKLPPREEILYPWLMTQSLNMIHGWRGTGKTHVSLGISYAVASGGNFLNWKAEKSYKVLLIDGEMAAASLQERLSTITKSSQKKPAKGFLTIITPDLQDGAMPDLSSYEGQEVINAAIEKCDAKLIVVDNLSCLVRGTGRENDAESWNSVSEWALMQRQKGRSVLFIHHSGKSGQQRGTSKREDVLDVVISLKHPPDYDMTTGACFEVIFEKGRHLKGDNVKSIEAKLTTDENGLSKWSYVNAADSNFDRIVTLANEGTSQADIAKELDINRSTVCRALKKAKEDNKISAETHAKATNQYNKMSNGE